MFRKHRLQKEKDRSDELLLNILPAEVAEELKEKGESEARDFEEVTVLFTDFMAFTETAQKLTAKQLVTEIDTSVFQDFGPPKYPRLFGSGEDHGHTKF